MTSKVERSPKGMIVRERREVSVSIFQRAYGIDRNPHFAYDELRDLGQVTLFL